MLFPEHAKRISVRGFYEVRKQRLNASFVSQGFLLSPQAEVLNPANAHSTKSGRNANPSVLGAALENFLLEKNLLGST